MSNKDSNNNPPGYQILLMGIFIAISGFIISGGCDGFTHRGYNSQNEQADAQEDVRLIEEFDQPGWSNSYCGEIKKDGSNFECLFRDYDR